MLSMTAKPAAKLSSILLSLALVFTFIFAVSPNAAHGSPNAVDLVYAKLDGFAYSPYIFGSIEVDNLAYSKEVYVVWRGSTSEAWKEKAATFDRTTTGNREAWKFIVYIGGPNTEFKIKYVVNGQTYWDTNNGSNYKISDPSSTAAPYVAIGNPPIKVNVTNSFYDYGVAYLDGAANQVHFTAFVKNLAFTKNVTFRYTTDNWQTYQDVSASYDSAATNSSNALELWKVTVPISSTVQNVKFSASYTVNGVTYWDNNLGLNYELTR
ncbi:CBM21 domain-containing protein [Paenibacillus oenotherae]|uniref:CBM21 domain-containing protein n=1 Tax=Paenibacillus oenotherae TaxID=1435645 RepID=A0ABS7D3H5_9BACL|nr:carbohydrate-binding protein [Paenibacillus oenotherae]MBW7474487.1 CBM21 domain-containing protein [Paenibacillus oenotherae]